MAPETQRLAFFLPDLGGGGTQKVVVTLANEMVARGYAVDMVLVQARGVNRKYLSEAVKVVDLGVASTYFSLIPLVAYMRSRRPYCLISSLDLTNLVALIAKAIAGTDVRVVIRIENVLSALQRTYWKKRLEKILLSLMYPRADDIIAVSRAVAKDIVQYTGLARARITTIYNPVITPQLMRERGDAPGHPWFDGNGIPVILGVGRLTAQKDFATLVKAFAIVRQQRAVRLLILGEGEDRGQLAALAKHLKVDQDVQMPGFAENAFAYMCHSKAFVLSSIYEGLPTVLIEALAAGLPTISTDCPGGSQEILADGAHGELVPMRNPEAMADAICRTLDAQARPASTKWLEQFEVQHVAEQTLKLLGLPGSISYSRDEKALPVR